MHPKSPKWLNDIQEACEVIANAVVDRSLEDYQNDRLLRAAIERYFEIIGEALVRIRKTDPETALCIPEFKAIIDFRNFLIHGYDFVENARVWKIIHDDVPPLRAKVIELLQRARRDIQS